MIAIADALVKRLRTADGLRCPTDRELEAAARIEALEADIAASEHNFKTMRQSRNEAAARIEALENALRVIIDEPDGCVSPAFKALAATALGPEQDK